MVRKAPLLLSSPLLPTLTMKGVSSRSRSTLPAASVTLRPSVRRLMLLEILSCSCVTTPSCTTQQSMALRSQSS
ncbi:hypothetical protein D3C72_2445190 [compost metagenome]